MQQVVVLLIILACVGYVGLQVYRFFRPKPGKACGSCCDAGKKPVAAGAGNVGAAAGAPRGERVMMISSDDLRARVKARKG